MDKADVSKPSSVSVRIKYPPELIKHLEEMTIVNDLYNPRGTLLLNAAALKFLVDNPRILDKMRAEQGIEIYATKA